MLIDGDTAATQVRAAVHYDCSCTHKPTPMADTAAIHLDAQHAMFHSEYQQELESWMRRRFRAMCIAYAGVVALVLGFRLIAIAQSEGGFRFTANLLTIGGAVASLATIGYFLYRNRNWHEAAREQLIRAAWLLIMMLGCIALLKHVLVIRLTDQTSDFILPLLFWHLLACLFLPWTPRESLRPVLPLLGLWAVGVLALRQDLTWLGRILTVTLVPVILVPGLLICAFRLRYHSESFRTRMVGKHFLTMRQEFARARSVHESMFPAPHEDGFVRFDYTYTPMRELGGDYVHLDVSPEGLVHVTLMDVTGHGLPAALTVNRLFGELERIRAESPLAEPGEVLTLLNRYIHLTMVKHNIFVTAVCMTLDPYQGKLHWANAGHPPAYMRGANGVVTQLSSTAVLLGALDPTEFTPDQRTIELSPGDVIILYTDGTFETRDRTGKSLGLSALRNLMAVQPSPRNWPQFIASAVSKHSSGRPDDDILIASLTFKALRPQPAPVQAVAS